MRRFLKRLGSLLNRWKSYQLRLEPLESLYPVDLRERGNHWSTFLYVAHHRPIVIDAPIERRTAVAGSEVKMPWRASDQRRLPNKWQRDRSAVQAVALVDTQGQWRWMPLTGHQARRVADRSMEGYAEIPVQIERVVYRAHAPHWPPVLNGDLSTRRARELFDVIFHA